MRPPNFFAGINSAASVAVADFVVVGGGGGGSVTGSATLLFFATTIVASAVVATSTAFLFSLSVFDGGGTELLCSDLVVLSFLTFERAVSFACESEDDDDDDDDEEEEEEDTPTLELAELAGFTKGDFVVFFNFGAAMSFFLSVLALDGTEDSPRSLSECSSSAKSIPVAF